MECPPVVGMNSYEVLLLKKILCGQAETPMIWFEKLQAGLEENIFESSSSDPCMLISNKVIYLVHFDDGLWFSNYMKHIYEVINSF